jgi:hypothetical protein
MKKTVVKSVIIILSVGIVLYFASGGVAIQTGIIHIL